MSKSFFPAGIGKLDQRNVYGKEFKVECEHPLEYRKVVVVHYEHPGIVIVCVYCGYHEQLEGH